jgi:hypothetical protein
VRLDATRTYKSLKVDGSTIFRSFFDNNVRSQSINKSKMADPAQDKNIWREATALFFRLGECITIVKSRVR